MPAPSIDANASYKVALTKSIKVGTRSVAPGPRVILRGDILAAQIAADPASVSDYKAEAA